MIDPRLFNEIEHGKKIAKNAGKVWNWESPAGKLRWARRVEMLADHINSDMNVLEIGCGTGYYTKELQKTGATITAIDISPDLIELAKVKTIQSNVSFLVGNAYQMSFKERAFHTVVGISVLHHLDIKKAIKEIYKVLKPGGQIAFSEPNMLNPQIAIEKNIPIIKKIVGDSPDETAFFKWNIRKLLHMEGFQNIEVTPFDFLHPGIPETFLPFFKPCCSYLEKLLILKEVAGSLYIKAQKPH